MDGFEPVRVAATRLHESVLSIGCDPVDPLALVTTAIDHLDLELAYVPAGDPALKGARALFDEQSGTICCEASGSACDRVLLVAHEIGHAVIHADSSSCGAGDIDPSRSTEMAPVGLQRVEDYGARERRELQADVFAREFLLPRVMAERLHMEDGLGATRIANLTGLPLGLVRQQLFDALLLPPPAPPAQPSVPTSPLRPDASQARAVTHRGNPFLLEAGPGTGKTLALVQRVSSLLAEGIDPAAILVVTFSNRAAGELVERLARANPEAAPRLWIGTIHAFGLDLMRRHHDRLDLPPDPMLFDRSDAIEILQEKLPTLPLVHYRNLWDPALVLRDVIAAISRAKDELADPVRYRSLAEAMLASATDSEGRAAAEKCLEIASIYEIYEEALRERDGVDFGDLVMRPALLLESDPGIAQATRLRHRHVLVDEYQDVNRASARLLRAVAGDGNRLWVVGDARQSIYRFRGASGTNLAHFATDYPSAVRAQLDVNYRSAGPIVETLVAVASRMGASEGMLPLDLTARRDRGSATLRIHRHGTPDDEAAGVAASVRELEDAGVALRQQAVLCRSNNRLNDLATALEERGIPVLHLGSLFEREEVRDLLALLSLAVDRFGGALVRVASMPGYDVSLQDVHAATRHLRSNGGWALTALESLAEADGVSDEGATAFKRIAEDLSGLNPRGSAWGFLVFLPARPDELRPQDGPCDHRDGEDASGCRVAVPEFRAGAKPGWIGTADPAHPRSCPAACSSRRGARSAAGPGRGPPPGCRASDDRTWKQGTRVRRRSCTGTHDGELSHHEPRPAVSASCRHDRRYARSLQLKRSRSDHTSMRSNVCSSWLCLAREATSACTWRGSRRTETTARHQRS